VVYAVGEEATTEGAGDFLQSDPAPPNFWEDSQTVPKVPLKETGETFSRVETQQVFLHDPWLLRYTEGGFETTRACGGVVGHAIPVGSDGSTYAGLSPSHGRFESCPLPYPLREHDPLTAYVHDVGFTLPMPAPPPSAVVRAAGALTEAQLREVLSEAGWPVGLHDQALSVMWCESRWNANAEGDRGSSVGLFQVQWSGSSWRGWFLAAGEDESLRFDPVVNARTALYAYNRSGWAPWSCKP
jgi:hypothetical protein